MKKQIHPVFAVVAIVSVLAVIGFFFWKANQDKPIPEGPGVGRIGQTMTLKPHEGGPKGSKAAKPPAPKPGEPKSGQAKSDEAP